MKDDLTMGAIAGFTGGIIGLLFSYSMFLLGVSPISSVHLAASLVVLDVVNLTAGGFFWSILTHFIVAGAFGILLKYLLRYTGNQNWAFKGVGLGVVLCLLAHSYFIPLMRTDIRELIFDAASFGTIITTHGLIGLIASLIIVRYHR